MGHPGALGRARPAGHRPDLRHIQMGPYGRCCRRPPSGVRPRKLVLRERGYREPTLRLRIPVMVTGDSDLS